MNDKDREEWVETTLEDFYVEWKKSGEALSVFVRANRLRIDNAIKAIPGTEQLFTRN